MGIIYVTLGIIILLGIIIGILFLIKVVNDMRKKALEKKRIMEDMMQNPDELVAKVGLVVGRAVFKSIKKAINKRRFDKSTE